MNSPLLTDLYQLTMGSGYWQHGLAEREAVFHLFYRRAPFGDRAVLVAGTGPAVDYLSALNFTPQELAYLAPLCGADRTPLFEQGYQIGRAPGGAGSCADGTVCDGGVERGLVWTCFERVSGRMEASDENAKEAGDALVSGALLPEGADADEGESFADNLTAFNRMVNTMLAEMSEADGACPAL